MWSIHMCGSLFSYMGPFSMTRTGDEIVLVSMDELVAYRYDLARS